MKELTQICESFNWLTPEFSILPTDKNTVKIKGVAMPPNTVSKNNKKYVNEEMTMAARTWIDAPVTPNHAKWSEKRNQKGKVNWMEYDPEDGTMEYVAEVWDPSLVAELRVYKENPKASKIRGVSIEADYLHIRCAKCGDKFFSEEEWRVHSEREHHLKDLPLEPHGIRGRALSIVLAPETPGVQGNTLEVMETVGHGLSQLLDIIVTNNKLKEEHAKEMSRIAITQEQPHAAVGRSKKVSSNIREQDHECPEGEHWDEEQQACVANAAVEQELPSQDAPADLADHNCPEGEHWDEQRQQCVLDTEVTEQEEQQCPVGEHWDSDKQMCVADEATAECNCPSGQHRNANGECVPNASEVVIREAKKIGKLTFKPLKKPIFEKLRETGRSHEDAAREIAQIEEINSSLQFIAETVNEVIDVVSKPLAVKVPVDDDGWKRIKPYNDKPLREAIARIKPYNDKALKEQVTSIKPYDDAEIKAELNVVKETVEKVAESIPKFIEGIKIADENVNVKGSIIETVQKTNKEITEKAEKWEKEAKELKEQLEKETTRAENAEDKLNNAPQFKGTTAETKETGKGQDLSYTPEKDKEPRKK